MTKETNARIPYSATGAGPAALLFIHGFLDSKEVWSPVIDLLADSKEVLVTVDLPGMGDLKNEKGEITLERYRDDVVSVIKTISSDVVLVAQSMGAQVAEMVASAVPERSAVMGRVPGDLPRDPDVGPKDSASPGSTWRVRDASRTPASR